MLAGDQKNSEEKLYSEPYAHLGSFQSESRETSRFLKTPEKEETSKSTPSRRKQNRSAFRENRKVKESPVVELQILTDPGNVNRQEVPCQVTPTPGPESPSSLKDAEFEDVDISLRRKVSLGDYAMPPDRMTEMPGGIPRINSTEYSEPYETSRMIQALRNEERAEQLRRSSPATLANSDVYSLAQNVEKSPSIHRSVSELKNQKYVTANSYEEPWDSQWKTKEFKDICDKAEEASSRRSSEGTSPSHCSKNNMANVYEDAWDTANKQKELEMKVQDAHRRRNSETVCTKFDYEEPAGQRKFSLGQADLKSTKKKWTPALSPPSIKDNKEQVYTSNYDCPWDNMQLEERLSRASGLSPPKSPTKSKRSSNGSDSSPGPPDFSPPPPPVQQAYEEAWDLRPQAKVIESSPKPRLTSPSHSTDGEGLSEKVDAKLPLDLQKFYHGGISRKQAEELLILYKIGSYLVRRSETQKNVFSLSLNSLITTNLQFEDAVNAAQILTKLSNQEMGLGLPDHRFYGHNGVSLGDYAMPPDRMTEMPGGIPRINSTEYSEPYETSRMIQALRNEERAEQLRRSSPATLANSDVYSLAQNVEKSPSIHRSVSELKNQKYVTANSYEEPWDSQWKTKEFKDICDKAEEASSRRSSEGTSPSHCSKNNMANVYEDAWDTANKQKELEMKVQDAHRRRNSETVCTKFDYEEPAGQRKFSLGQADLKSTKKKWTPALSPPSIKDNKEQVYTSNYDCPWDNMQLEERLSRASGLSPPKSPTKSKRSSNGSDSSPGPPDFSPPPPPVQQAYEEAWDLRPQAKVLESSPKPRLTSPSHSTDGEGLSEKVDAKLPLDLQKFYHGGISRKQAEELLILYKIGSYLVRRSETQKNVFSLSLKGVGGIPMHLRIGLEHGEYILGENSQPFPTVPELIAYYTKHELPIQNANHIRLQFPIPRNQGMY
ncbi:hypothetical protein FSP39_006619 [Pinctada imbricata]|uniref:SH2 domain-containing protein n=1 Tax=Pinctada imbricata TaxID=66713 RepID=A0AA88Y3F3_PINIB|nr:hypothetical protein FSP39_006619 [Pinctada imbricata]